MQFQISHRQGAGILAPLELSVGFFRAGSPAAPGACGWALLQEGDQGQFRV